MKTRLIPAIVTLVAAFVVSVTNIINKIEMVPGFRNLLVVIIIFYIFGMIAKTIIERTIQSNDQQTEVTEATEQDSEETVTSEEPSTNDKLDQ